MKATIPLALILGGCNYDYAIMESPDEPSSETVVIYQQGTIPSPESSTPDIGEAPTDTITADTDTDAPLSEETDEPAVEDTDPVVDTGVPLEVPPDSDEPPPEDTDVVVDPVPDPPPAVDTDLPVDTGEPPPPVDPGPEWRTVYFEDFEDGTSDLASFNGGCGGQSVSGGSWNMYSDWNGARVPVPDVSNAGVRLTTTVTLGATTWHAVVRWKSNDVAWNYNDNAGFSYHLIATEASGLWVNGGLHTPYSVPRGVPTEIIVEEYGGAYVVSVDSVLVADGFSDEAPGRGTGLEFHSNGDCLDNLMSIQDVHIEVAD